MDACMRALQPESNTPTIKQKKQSSDTHMDECVDFLQILMFCFEKD